MAKKKAKTSKKNLLFIEIAVLLIAFVATVHFLQKRSSVNALPIGLNIELSGSLSSVGASSKQAAELAVQQINQQGGVMIAGKKYPLVLSIADNGSSASQTQIATKKLFSDGVVAMIGPNASTYAIAASDLAEKSQVLMISPWSTDPATTMHKSYVYRTAFLDPFQGEALANFATHTLHATRAAIFYDKTAGVLKGQSDDFQTEFGKNNGKIVAVQGFTPGTKDFTTALRSLAKANPQVIFLPAYYTDAAAIITQARTMGVTARFLGSDAWGGQQILSSCGGDCNGVFYSAHYAPDAKNPKTIQFVFEYEKTYRQVPDDVAALTYDTVDVLAQALQQASSPTRSAIAASMRQISSFDGVTGRMLYTKGSGDPQKTVVIMGIDNNTAHWVANIEPK